MQKLLGQRIAGIHDSINEREACVHYSNFKDVVEEVKTLYPQQHI
jgi:hypothetical protein